MFHVVLDQVCIHTAAGILAHSSIQVFSRSFRFWGCRWATQSFSSLHRFSIGFRSGDWLGHSRTLKCFLRSHSLVALAVCLGSLSCWKTQLRPIFNALTEGRRSLAKILRYMAPSILHSIRCSHPVPFAEKHPHASRLGWGSWDCTHPSKHSEWSLYQKVLFWSHLTTWPSSHASTGSSRWSLANFRRNWKCAGLSRGTCMDFNPWRCSVLLMVTVKTVVPALFRALTRSSRVVLGWSLTFLRITDTPQREILHGAPVRGRLTVILNFFHFLIIAPTVVAFSPSYCPVAIPALCRSLDSSLVLPIVERLESDWLSVWTGVFYTGNELKQVQLIQVMSVG